MADMYELISTTALMAVPGREPVEEFPGHLAAEKGMAWAKLVEIQPEPGPGEVLGDPADVITSEPGEIVDLVSVEVTREVTEEVVTEVLDADGVPTGESTTSTVTTIITETVMEEQRRPILLWTLTRAWAAVPAPLDGRRAAVVGAINAERDRLMALGAEHEGKLFALDDVSRTDLGGMATTGALVIVGALSWPAEYQLGWISLDNTRLPLPDAQAGIALAAAVARRYAELVQRARDLKDEALASDDPEAIDITAGWPA